MDLETICQLIPVRRNAINKPKQCFILYNKDVHRLEFNYAGFVKETVDYNLLHLHGVVEKVIAPEEHYYNRRCGMVSKKWEQITDIPQKRDVIVASTSINLIKRDKLIYPIGIEFIKEYISAYNMGKMIHSETLNNIIYKPKFQSDV